MTNSGLRRLLMVAAALAVGTANISIPMVAYSQEAGPGEEVQAEVPRFSMPQDAVLFRAFGEEMTVGAFEEIVRYTPPSALARPGVVRTVLSNSTPEEVRVALEEFIRNEAIRRRHDEEGTPLGVAEEEGMARALTTASQITWIDAVGLYDPLEISDEEVRQFYEEVKNERYRQEEQVTLRHIFFSTYVEHTVQDGETLESIAEAISGDPAAVDRILTKDTRRPRVEEVPTDHDENLPPRALRAGEELMVPGGPELVAEVRARAQSAYDRIIAGEDFIEVANQVSETATPNRPIVLRPQTDEKPMIPEVLENFYDLEDGGVSDPFQTRHGFQLIKRVAYREDGYRPFESVEAVLRSEIENERRQKMYDDIMSDLWARTEVISLNEDVLARALSEEAADEVLFEIDEVLYPASSYRRDYGQRLSADASMEERRAVLVNQPIIQRTLLEEDINRREIRGSELFRNRVRMLQNQVIAQSWATARTQEHEPEVGEEEIRERFEQMIPALTQRPSVDLWRITVEVPMGGIVDSDWYQRRTAELESRLADVTSAEEFEALARELSTDRRADEGGRLGRVGDRGENGLAGQLIREGLTNRPTEVQRTENSVRVYWVGDIYETSEPNLEEQRQGIVLQLRNAKRSEFYEQLMAGALDGMDHEILVP